VFEVTRIANGEVCALKFVEPKSDKERNIIKNEVGIMMMCGEGNDSVLQCYEIFDYK
jgi:hypothetical protein